ncbi:MAG: ABC transporter ATP-binding protein [Nitrospirae bacterium]|nr:MAG: ABC transporter ATP-binding protein [Nitrospirota bacterium]
MTRQLLFILKPYRLSLAAILVLLSVSAALESAGISLFVPLFLALGQAGGSLPVQDLGVFTSLERYLQAHSVPRQIQIIAAALVATVLVKSLFGYAGRLLAVRLEHSAISDLRKQVFGRYMAADYQFFLDRRQGRLVNDLFQEGGTAGQAVSTTITLLSNGITAAALYLLLLFLSWQATMIATGTFLLLTLGFYWVSMASGRLGRTRQALVGEFVSFGAEAVLGIRQVKVFGAEGRLAARFADLAGRVRQANLDLQSLSLLAQPVGEVVAVLVLAAMVMTLSAGIFHEASALVPFLVTFLVVLIRLFPVIVSLNRDFIRLKGDMASVQIVTDLLAPSETAKTRDGGRLFTELRQGVGFEGVTFRYPGKPEPPALRDVVLTFPAGKVTALVGPSGAGKSTVVDLLIRLYEPSEGRIMVDGTDLREYSLESWRNAIGFVSQDTFIFNASIRENIAFGMPDATEGQIVEAARQADAHDFIQGLPEGYATVVGDRGLKLSGGERQRIAIARAVLRNPIMLIFDEATSSLDNESEQRVQQAINRLSRDRTVIMIAHRLSTIVGADKIAVLDRGRVAEEGTHASLLERRGLYWKLYSRESADVDASDPDRKALPTGPQL